MALKELMFVPPVDPYEEQSTALHKKFGMMPPQPGASREPQVDVNEGALGDLGTDVKRGLFKVPGALTGIADIVPGLVGAGTPVSDAFDWLGEKTGFQPSQWEEEAKLEYSPEGQFSRNKLSEAISQGVGPTLATIGSDPLGTLAPVIAESLPMMLAGGGVGKGLQLASGAVRGGKAFSPLVAGAAGEGAIAAGASMDEMADKIDPQRAAVGSLGLGIGTGLLGAAGGKVAQKLGVADVDTLFTGGLKQLPKDVAGRVARKAVQGATIEGLLEELPQSLQEKAWQNWMEGKPLDSELLATGVVGALAGGVMGGVAGAATGAMAPANRDAVLEAERLAQEQMQREREEKAAAQKREGELARAGERQARRDAKAPAVGRPTVAVRPDGTAMVEGDVVAEQFAIREAQALQQLRAAEEAQAATTGEIETASQELEVLGMLAQPTKEQIAQRKQLRTRITELRKNLQEQRKAILETQAYIEGLATGVVPEITAQPSQGFERGQLKKPQVREVEVDEAVGTAAPEPGIEVEELQVEQEIEAPSLTGPERIAEMEREVSIMLAEKEQQAQEAEARGRADEAMARRAERVQIRAALNRAKATAQGLLNEGRPANEALATPEMRALRDQLQAQRLQQRMTARDLTEVGTEAAPEPPVTAQAQGQAPVAPEPTAPAPMTFEEAQNAAGAALEARFGPQVMATVREQWDELSPDTQAFYNRAFQQEMEKVGEITPERVAPRMSPAQWWDSATPQQRAKVTRGTPNVGRRHAGMKWNEVPEEYRAEYERRLNENPALKRAGTTMAARAGYTSARIDHLLSEYAYTMDDDKTKAHVAYIDPEAYVRATAPGAYKQVIEDESGPLDADRLRRESQTPFLKVDASGTIIGHEGRHRMQALANAGIKRVPVIIRNADGPTSDNQLEDARVLRGQYVTEYGRGEDVVVRNLIPINYRHADKVARMYGRESDVMFAQGSGPGQSPDAVRSRLVAVFGEKAVGSMEASGLLLIENDETSDLAGSWDGTTIWLNPAGMLQSDDPIGYLLHEGGEHAGMEAMLGDSYEALQSRFDVLIANGNEFALEALTKAETRANRPEHVKKERLAYFIQDAWAREQAGELQGPAKALFRRLVNGLKAWFRSTGLGRAMARQGIDFELTDGYAVALAKRSLDRAVKAAQATTALGVDGRVMASFAGKYSRMADHGALSDAVTAVENGADPNRVRNLLGWFQGPDGEWRYEIADSDLEVRWDKIQFVGDGGGRVPQRIPRVVAEERARADSERLGEDWDKLSPETQKRYVDHWQRNLQELAINQAMPKGRGPAKLLQGRYTFGDIIDHPKLTAAYPWVANLNIKPLQTVEGSNTLGMFEIDAKAWQEGDIEGFIKNPGTVFINEKILNAISQEMPVYGKGFRNAEEVRDRLIRMMASEMMRAHAQNQPMPYTEEEMSAILDDPQAYAYAVYNMRTSPDQATFINILLHEVQHAIQTFEGFVSGASTSYFEGQGMSSDAAFRMYRDNVGEVEARDVELRRGFMKEVLRTVPPEIMDNLAGQFHSYGGLPEDTIRGRANRGVGAREAPPDVLAEERERPVAYTLRTDPPPTKTVKAFKAFRERDGKLYAMYVGANDPLPVGEWLDATEGGYHFTATNGIKYTPTTRQKGMTSVQIPNDEVRQQLIARGYLPEGSKAKTVRGVSYRPGWHGGNIPFFPQGGTRKNLKFPEGYPYKNAHEADTVIAEVELDASNDLQPLAGKNGIQAIPKGGVYTFQANPAIKGRPELGEWVISGGMKIKRVLSRQEVNAMLDAADVPRQLWQDELPLAARAQAVGKVVLDGPPQDRGAVYPDEQTKMEEFRRLYQDQYLAGRRMDSWVDQERARNGLGPLPTEQRIYDQLDLVPTKVFAESQKFQETYRDPLLRLANEAGASQEDIEDFVYARTAPEVNQDGRERRAKLYLNELIKRLPKAEGARVAQEMAKIRETISDKHDRRRSYLGLLEREIVNDPVTNGEQELRNDWDFFKTRPSGMTAEESQEILDRWAGNEKMQQLGELFDAMNREAADRARRGGLLSEDEHARWIANRQHYANLQREGYVEEDSTEGAGPGMFVGKASKTQEFSTRRAKYAFTNSLIKAELLHKKAIKNEAMNALAQTIRDNEAVFGDKLEVRKLDTTAYRDDESGSVQYGLTKQIDLTKDIVFYENGEKKIIRANETSPTSRALMRSLNNLDANAITGMTKIARAFGNWQRAIFVSLSPYFIMRNVPRDIGTALYNLSAADAPGSRGAVMKGYLPALKAMVRYEIGKDRTSADAKLVQRYMDAGGRIGWVDSFKQTVDSAKTLKRRMNELEPGNPRRFWAQTRDFIEGINSATENAIRLAAFKHLTTPKTRGGAGYSDAKAARLVKDLTTNFTRKGQRTPHLDSWFLFANAAMQGQAQILRNIKEHPKSYAKMIGATMLAAFVLDQMNRAGSEDDDEGDKIYNKLPGYVKNTNIVVDGGDGQYVTIPAPWGYSWFWNIGRSMSEFADWQEGTNPDFNPAKAAMDITVNGAQNFMPIYSDSPAQLVLPTILDPIYQLGTNENAFGGKLYADKFPGDSTPSSMMPFRNTPEYATEFAKFLNELPVLSGGNEAKAGLLDVPPEVIELAMNMTMGGLYQIGKDIYQTTKDRASGVEPPPNKEPFKRIFIHEPSSNVETALYHERAAQVLAIDKQLRYFSSGPGRDIYKRNQVREDNAALARMIPYTKSVESRLRDLRKQRRIAERSGQDLKAQNFDKQIKKLQEQFNSRFRSRVLNS